MFYIVECEVWEYFYFFFLLILYVVFEYLLKEKVLGVYLLILVKNIDFIFVVELNFKVLIFYVYVLLKEIVGFF